MQFYILERNPDCLLTQEPIVQDIMKFATLKYPLYFIAPQALPCVFSLEEQPQRDTIQ